MSRGRAGAGRPARLGPDDPVTALKGIGPRTAERLAAVGVHRVLDLLLHLPRRYQDRTRTVAAADVTAAAGAVLVRGALHKVKVRSRWRHGRGVMQAELVDDSGAVPVVWFNQTWLAARLEKAEEVYLYGPVRTHPATGVVQLVNPEVEEAGGEDAAAERVVPVYPKLGPLTGARLRRLVVGSLEALAGLTDPLPAKVLRSVELPALSEALEAIHRPPAPSDDAERLRLLDLLNLRATPAHRRLAFDELLVMTGNVGRFRERRRRQRALRCPAPAGGPETLLDLPFVLTPAQRRVLDEIFGDLGRPFPMARLLQGDVGSGKTVVAALAAAAALARGYQVAVMAPTELLAEQHFRTLSRLFEGGPHGPLLLTGSLPAPERRAVADRLAGPGPALVVGTHALIQEGVSFDRLALVVVDEQHRFGVAQRQALVEKGAAPHLLVMTATPIPRTLALTAYGDLDLAVIDELPPGRRPVRTVVRRRGAADRLWRFLRQETEAGRRAFVVYPLIEGSDEVAAHALEENLPAVRSALGPVRVGVLHGRMQRTEREAVAEAFRSGEVQVLLATTVVEVGVDVPEATVMVIESPERFGLSQLHQLRGRVGRSDLPSWCVLLVEDGIGEPARRRLEVFCRTSDGFRLAEADLELRGPGELAGLRQWGADGFRFASIFRDTDLLLRARETAGRLCASGELDRVLGRLAEVYPVEEEVLSVG